MLDDQFSGLDETQCTELIEIYDKLFLSNCSIIFTIGNENYKKRKNILKLLKFDKYFYIYDAKMQKINSLDEFEEKKINIDTIKFLNGKYYNYGTYLEFQDGFINIYFETRFISVEGDVYNRLKEKLSLKTNESEDIILTSCEELNFDSLSLDAFLDKLSCENIIIYSALDGERLI